MYKIEGQVFVNNEPIENAHVYIVIASVPINTMPIAFETMHISEINSVPYFYNTPNEIARLNNINPNEWGTIVRQTMNGEYLNKGSATFTEPSRAMVSTPDWIYSTHGRKTYRWHKEALTMQAESSTNFGTSSAHRLNSIVLNGDGSYLFEVGDGVTTLRRLDGLTLVVLNVQSKTSGVGNRLIFDYAQNLLYGLASSEIYIQDPDDFIEIDRFSTGFEGNTKDFVMDENYVYTLQSAWNAPGIVKKIDRQTLQVVATSPALNNNMSFLVVHGDYIIVGDKIGSYTSYSRLTSLNKEDLSVIVNRLSMGNITTMLPYGKYIYVTSRRLTVPYLTPAVLTDENGYFSLAHPVLSPDVKCTVYAAGPPDRDYYMNSQVIADVSPVVVT